MTTNMIWTTHLILVRNHMIQHLRLSDNLWPILVCIPKFMAIQTPNPQCALYTMWLQAIQIGGGRLHARRKDPHKTYNTPRFGHCNKMATWW